MNGSLRLLDWDSKFFRMKTGSTYGRDTTDTRKEIQRARKEGYQLIYSYSEYPLNHDLLDEFGGLDVGGQVTFGKDIGGPPATQTTDDRIFLYEERKPNQKLLELALLSGHLSRFCTDTRLPPGSYQKMYKEWLGNSLEAQGSASVFISGGPINATGLITASWENDQCVIGLLAVSPDAQGRGLGSSLLRRVQHEATIKGIAKVTVKTQAVNQKARLLYSRNGYSIERVACLYHFIPRNNQ